MLDIKTVNKKKVVCILGMGRSGTSMTTRVINLMGIFLGETENMMPANKDVNAEGFWEHLKIVDIHDEILNEFNSSWESTKPLPDKWWQLPKIEEYRDKLIKLIETEFSNHSIWAFKDPRTCVMLPLWKEIFGILNIEPMFVIPIRNPVDIANSLKKRDGFSLNYSMRIWYYHMINILEGTEEYKRIFIKYDDMMENTDINLSKLTDFLDIQLSDENIEVIKRSLKPNLRHSKTKEDELNLVTCTHIVDLYNICMKFIDNPYSEVDLKYHSSEMYKRYGELMEVRYSDEFAELEKLLEEEKIKVAETSEKLNQYKNDNLILSKEKEDFINKCNLLNKEKNIIIIENESERLVREKEAMESIHELRNKYEFVLKNKLQLDEQVESILNSPSWRVTKPLRIIKRLFLSVVKRKGN